MKPIQIPLFVRIEEPKRNPISQILHEKHVSFVKWVKNFFPEAVSELPALFALYEFECAMDEIRLLKWKEACNVQ